MTIIPKMAPAILPSQPNLPKHKKAAPINPAKPSPETLPLPMFLKKNHGPRIVMLSDGSVLSLADLPDVGTRWVASRKAIVVDAVNHGLITRDEAIRRYGLTEEEFDTWSSAVRKHGRNALKITQLQKFRQL